MFRLGWRIGREDSAGQLLPQPSAGRWHVAGDPVLYCASTPELAVLEARVHHRRGESGYLLQAVMCDAEPRVDSILAEALPVG